jgi:hypothetical protein
VRSLSGMSKTDADNGERSKRDERRASQLIHEPVNLPAL